MKKEYTEPKAEKVEFNYQEAIVASNTTPSEEEELVPQRGKGYPACYNHEGTGNGTYSCPKYK